MIKQFEIRIHGRVQGVGFRATARNQARSLGLKGWVENLPDGSVNAVIKGTEIQCHAFMHWCRKGTGYSWVERLEIKEQKPDEINSFQIRY